MSDFTAIWAVSSTLQALLTTQINADPQISNPVTISLSSPKAIKSSSGNGSDSSISVWLYRVTRNEYTLNNRPNRNVANQLPGPPIPINLYYLITPMSEEAETQQKELGKILQVCNDFAILRGSDLQDSLQGSTEELRLTLETLSLEELTQVWYSLQETYQLSVSYLVQVVTIESSQEPVNVSPVLVRNTTYAQILDVQ